MSDLLFRIKGGELIPTDPDCGDFRDVLNKRGYIDVDEPALGDIVVVVGAARRPIRYVPRDRIALGTVGVPDQDIYLFWAVDEDSDGAEVVVAFDICDVSSDPHGLWRVIGFEEWVHLPPDQEPIRAFRSLDDARVYLADCAMVFIPFTMEEGWRGVKIYGPDLPWFDQDIRAVKNPRVIETAEIPSGIVVRNVIDQEVIPTLRGLMKETEGDRTPKEMPDQAELVYIVVTGDGSVALVGRFQEGESGSGIAIITRTFTHEEAKTILTL